MTMSQPPVSPLLAGWECRVCHRALTRKNLAELRLPQPKPDEAQFDYEKRNRLSSLAHMTCLQAEAACAEE